MTLSIYKGKLAQKVLILFVTASFVPLLVGSIVSYHHIHRIVVKENKENLRSSAKEYGLSIYSRLKAAKDSLLNNKFYLESNINKAQHNLLPYFSALGTIEDSEMVSLFWGDIDSAILPKLNKSAMLYTIGKSESRKDVYIFIENKYFGKVNSKYLWHRELFSEDIAFCVTNIDFNNLFCDSDYHNFITSGKSPITMNWSLFLDHEFNIDDWIINTTQSQETVDGALLDFKIFFIPLLLLSLFSVLLFSSILVRKNLTTIQKLINTTKAFKENNFSARLQLDRNDEFYEVAESFNAMSEHISNTFQQNKLLADIDQTALTSESLENLFSTIFDYIFYILPTNEVLFLANPNINKNFNNAYYKNKTENKICHKNIDSPYLLTANLKKNRHLLKTEEFKISDISKKWTFSKQSIAVLPISFDNHDWHYILIALEPSNTHLIQEDKVELLISKLALSFKALHKDYQLSYKANHDFLTGIANENFVTELHNKQIKKLKDGSLISAFLFIDLDKFKQVNDNYGHTVGDKLLKAVVVRLQRLLTNKECFARLGGDEFLVRITATNEEILLSRANILCEQITQKANEPFSINGTILHIGSSIGVSVSPKDAIEFEDALRFADIAMYISKKDGGNSYSVYDTSMSKELLKQTLLERDLRADLEKKDIAINYQPKVDAVSKSLQGFEALLRWKNSTYGDVSPWIAIEMAERIGMIDVLGNIILELTLKQMNTWLGQGYTPGKIAINVCPEQLKDKSFIDFIKEQLEEHSHVQAEMIELEITEDVLLNKKAQTLSLLKEIRELGISIAIDDFGTGYSSLSYLLDIPANTLKIDRAFLLKLEQDDNALSLLSSLITLGKNMGYTIVAEGVETEQQAAFLTQCQVDELQGYLYSKPLPPELAEKRFLSDINNNNVVRYQSK
jgi:diguanylate cyclase (GGDEF)-like protein